MNEEQTSIMNYLNINALGYSNRKSSSEIRDALHLESGGATNEHVRDLIRDLILNHSACIGSLMWRDGYCIIQTEEELNRVCGSLENRANSILNRAKTLRNNFNNNTQ